jgi:hypothetical protein
MRNDSFNFYNAHCIQFAQRYENWKLANYSCHYYVFSLPIVLELRTDDFQFISVLHIVFIYISIMNIVFNLPKDMRTGSLQIFLPLIRQLTHDEFQFIQKFLELRTGSL